MQEKAVCGVVLPACKGFRNCRQPGVDVRCMVWLSQLGCPSPAAALTPIACPLLQLMVSCPLPSFLGLVALMKSGALHLCSELLQPSDAANSDDEPPPSSQGQRCSGSWLGPLC